MILRRLLLLAVVAVGGLVTADVLLGKHFNVFPSFKKAVLQALGIEHGKKKPVVIPKPPEQSPYISELMQKMVSVPLGTAGPAVRSCDTELARHQGRDVSEIEASLPPACLEEFKRNNWLRAYPEQLSIFPGGVLPVYVALRADLAAQKLTGLKVRPVRASIGAAKSLPLPEMLVAPKACRSYWGTGCAFDQVVRVDTAGLQPGGYILTIETVGASTNVGFVVRTLEKRRIRIVVPDWTFQAYSQMGGGSLYWKTDADSGYDRVNPFPRLLRVSTKRPFGAASSIHDVKSMLGKAAWFQETWEDVELVDLTDLHGISDWRTLADTLVIIGHNEYMSAQHRSAMAAFLAQGGNIVNLSGNTAWWQTAFDGTSELMVSKVVVKYHKHPPIASNTGLTFHSDGPSIESVLGTSYQFGGLDVARGAKLTRGELPQAGDSGVAVICAHPAFTRAGLTKGDQFGARSKVIEGEIDGLPVTAANQIRQGVNFPEGAIVRVIGTARIVPSNTLYYSLVSSKKNIVKIGAMVEYRPSPKSGRVIGLPSMGTVDAIDSEDRVAEAVIRNLVQYIVDGDFDDQKELVGCPWQQRFTAQ